MGVEEVRTAHEQIDVGSHRIGDASVRKPIWLHAHDAEGEHLLGVEMRSGISDRRAVAPPPGLAVGFDRAAVLGPPALSDLQSGGAVRLGRVKESVIGAHLEVTPNLPTDFRLNSRAVTDSRTVLGAREEGCKIEHVDDLV